MLVTLGAQRDINLYLYRTSLISVLSAHPALCLNSSLLFDCYFLPRREYNFLRFTTSHDSVNGMKYCLIPKLR